MFRFTIRDVLWLTVVIGMGIGWWMQIEKTRARDRLLDGVATIVNDSGLLEIKETSPGKLLVTQGKLAKELLKPAAKNSTPAGQEPSATLKRP